MSSTSEHRDPRLAAVLADLFARTSAGIKFGLGPTRELLAALGNPQRRGRYVLIAGTNGKGSTARTLAEALGHAGHRVGLYTSPHLLRFSERIRVLGREIEPALLLELHGQICAAERSISRPVTFFEAATAIALLAFDAAKLDVAVLEVGLGGRLDATNVVTPMTTVITPIGLDHTLWLGDTLQLIAAEKGAILPTDGTGVLAPQPPEALAVLEQMAAERGTTVHMATHHTTDAGLVLSCAGQSIVVPLPPAPFFADSLAAAWGAYGQLSAMGLSAPGEAFVRGTRSVQHRGRFEWHDDALVLDAAHNPPALTALAAALDADPRTLRDGIRRPHHVVFACMADKDLGQMLALACGLGDALYLATVPVRRGASLEQLTPLAPNAHCFERPEHALHAAREAAALDGGLVVVTGSMFLVSEALGILTDEPRDPPIAG